MRQRYKDTFTVIGALSAILLAVLVSFPESSKPKDVSLSQLTAQSYVAEAGEGADHLATGTAGRTIGASLSSSGRNPQVRDGAVVQAGAASLFHTTKNEVPPQVAIHGGLVADLGSGEIYYSNHSVDKWPLASITKLVTAVFALENIPSYQPITITSQVRAEIGDEAGSTLPTGSSYRADDLITAMLAVSSNEAAEGLAQFYGRDAFIAGMNARLRQWGITNTTFYDPTGLSVANQSTSEDIMKIAKCIYADYPSLYAASRASRIMITELASGRKEAHNNINQFAGRVDFIGGKTGFTDEAQGNLVSLFAYENRPIIIVVMGTDDRFGTTETLFNWFKRTHSSR
ncbi:MAG: serine hydrolase [Candidatus Liptonbacteria bacterium]